VIYYRPDFHNLLQSYLWQTEDVVPELFRVHQFLNHWKQNINAKIKEILVSHGGRPNWRNIEEFKT
jgi:uncharacterized protein Usg